MSKIKPNFLIVGAPKAGTTSLYYYLKQHDDIAFPKIKETKYFSSQVVKYPQVGPGDWSIDKYAVTSRSKYFDLFKKFGNYKKIGEASPDYLLYSKKIAPLIRKELGDIPIIITLRDPVNRAFSAYSNMIRDNREFLSFTNAIKKENERAEKGWDFMWKYLECGMYYNQVLDYKKNFSNVKVIIFEDFIKYPLNSINLILEFLNLKKLNRINNYNYNPSGKPTNFFIRFILSRQNIISTLLRQVLKSFVPRLILEKIARIFLKKNKMTEDERNYLKNHFIDDVTNLERLLNIKLKKKWNLS